MPEQIIHGALLKSRHFRENCTTNTTFISVYAILFESCFQVFFRNIVEREPLPQFYIPELNDVTDIQHVSVHKIILLKGKNRGAVLGSKEIINSDLWARAGLASLREETVCSLFQIFIGNGRTIDDGSNNNCIQCAFCREP